jgi:hypothetical protein
MVAAKAPFPSHSAPALEAGMDQGTGLHNGWNLRPQYRFKGESPAR